MTGAVLSILIGPTLAKPSKLPALSMQSPSLLTFVPVVSVVRVWLSPATVLTSMPDWTEPVSAQVKVTETLVLFQPLALAAGLARPLMTGAVWSIWKSSLVTPVAVLPARSVQGSEVTLTAVPSPVVVLDWALLGKARAQAALGPEIGVQAELVGDV